MKRLELEILLLSDTTFGRGDGVAGLVDEEITHDLKTGLPFIRGRVLKGLLVEECANLLYALQNHPKKSDLETAAAYLFGRPGSHLADDASMRVGTARLDETLRKAVGYAVKTNVAAEQWQSADVLQSLTAIRRQTAVDEERDSPERGSLRSSRVLLRQTTLTAPLTFRTDPDETALALLAACVAGMQRGGSGRNRGRGRLQAQLTEQTTYFANFKSLIAGGAA